MKKNSTIALTGMLLILCFIACRRDFIRELQTTPLSITEAQSWYAIRTQPRSTSSDTAKRFITDFTPLWEKAKEFEDDKYYAVECPIRFAKPIGFSIRDGGDTSNISKNINGNSRLLVLRDKQSGAMMSVLI